MDIVKTHRKKFKKSNKFKQIKINKIAVSYYILLLDDNKR